MTNHMSRPCSECPWRKEHLSGWLGGYPAEYFADALRANEIHPCHKNDHGPDHPDSLLCAGALAVAANSCIQPYRTERAIEAMAAIGRREDCFAHYSLFFKHHTGEDYVHPLMRLPK